jgi:hypothetical protein
MSPVPNHPRPVLPMGCSCRRLTRTATDSLTTMSSWSGLWRRSKPQTWWYVQVEVVCSYSLVIRNTPTHTARTGPNKLFSLLSNSLPLSLSPSLNLSISPSRCPNPPPHPTTPQPPHPPPSSPTHIISDPFCCWTPPSAAPAAWRT